MGARWVVVPGGGAHRLDDEQSHEEVLEMTISQEDARRAIELLTIVCDRDNDAFDPPEDLNDLVLEFLYDDAGNPRFAERDPSPTCRCGECHSGDYTCVSKD
jgi:hypothetical protein